MEIRRDTYLNKLVEHRGNQRIKIVTGIRRCGKSYLLFHLFKDYLLKSGVPQSRIIEIQLDDRANKSLRNPDNCLAYIRQKVRGKGRYYLLIDEVQMMDEFEDVLNSCLHIGNLDIAYGASGRKSLKFRFKLEFGESICLFGYMDMIAVCDISLVGNALDYSEASLEALGKFVCR